jgi:putative polymerase
MTIIVQTPTAAHATRVRYGLSAGQRLAAAVTCAAVLYNFILCYVNTNLYGINPNTAIEVEIILIVSSLALAWDCGSTLYVVLILVAAYFYAIMVIRGQFDPKILRDVLIPISFFFLGRRQGGLRSADRLVTILIVVAFAAALFEWLALDSYLHYFDVSRYYIARGTATQEQHQYFEGFFNSTRFDNRTLLPFLGDHRVSGIMLEAPSVGNFGAIVFAWVLLRPKQPLAFVTKAAAIFLIIVLADARFGLYFSIFIFVIYVLSVRFRSTVIFIAPFIAMIALAGYATLQGPQAFDNDMLGRLLYAGRILSHIDPLQVFGLQASDINTGAGFASDPVNDSAYTYVLVEIGIVGAAGLWALFAYAPVASRDGWRFKTVIALYYILVLTIAASAFTIKTAALLWFLYGTLKGWEAAALKGESSLGFAFDEPSEPALSKA